MEKYVKELYFKNNLNNINVVFLGCTTTSNKNIKIYLFFYNNCIKTSNITTYISQNSLKNKG
jgi:hypothetical protein